MPRSVHVCFCALALTATVVSGDAASAACDEQALRVVVFNDNGAWSWFEDERALIDPVAGTLLVSSVADAAGSDGPARDGNVELVAYDLVSEEVDRVVLHAGLEADDHDSAALYVRADGRYLAMYSRHATDAASRWRVTRDPADPTVWKPESTIEHVANASYSNLSPGFDGNEGVLYAFVRSAGRDPHLLVSRDDGSTWEHGGRLLDGPGRPYVRYVADHFGRVHLVTTEQHPDDYANGIYYGVVTHNQLLRADGAVVDTDLGDTRAAGPEQLTKLFAGDAFLRTWTLDLQVDSAGYPYAAFSVHSRADGHRYYYARFDGVDWHVHPMARAGSALYDAQPHYTGLVALHPNDPNRVFVSTDVHPLTGVPLVSDGDRRQHHELFEGVTADGGVTWSWYPVTRDSTADNIRPIVPVWDVGHTALLWLRGTYSTYENYDLDVVGIVTSGTAVAAPDRGVIRCGAAQFESATASPLRTGRSESAHCVDLWRSSIPVASGGRAGQEFTTPVRPRQTSVRRRARTRQRCPEPAAPLAPRPSGAGRRRLPSTLRRR